MNVEKNIQPEDLKIHNLGECEYETPINKMYGGEHGQFRFIDEDDSAKILFHASAKAVDIYAKQGMSLPSVEQAGPRRKIFFDPAKSCCAIVTCGGLCPGINDVIRSLVMQAHYRYGIPKIWGIRYGYEGFIEKYGHTPVELTPEVVANIPLFGGSILGCSRGNQSTPEIVDWLQKHEVNILFVIGGDGTIRGAIELCKEIERRKTKISVVGIPKTVDNDLMYMDSSFGFETAFTEAGRAVNKAHAEALGAPNGIALVKLMGRYSGYIASYATLASNEVNFTLVPESPLHLDGAKGFLKALHDRMIHRGHAVIVAAEGAGQNLMDGDAGHDASGNAKLKDIGLFLKQKITEYFDSIKCPINLKYIDPSYLIRSVPANPRDSVFCARLAQHAVHAAICGKTRLVIARRHMIYVHLPMDLVTSGRQQVDTTGDLWFSVLESTGQPIEFE
jgi:6-phosphofructokinase 1